MSFPYVGEIRMFAGNFAPAGWAFCDGQTLQISENDALFTLIGTTYGGDGQETFNLPDLRGRAPIHQGSSYGSSYVIGEASGVETVTLTMNQTPNHTHALSGSLNLASDVSPASHVLAQGRAVSPYLEDVPNVTMNPAMLNSVGGSQPHDNMQPFLCISFIISLYGVFPSPS